MGQRTAEQTTRATRVGHGALAVLALALICQACSRERPPPPNIVLYVVDTLRADALGVYGNTDSSSPGIDAFASEGVVFENAYANASWTRASMGSLLTGLLPWNHGAEGRDDRLPGEVVTLAEILSQRGYATALVSSNPNVGPVFGFEQSFDEVIELYARTQPGPVRGKELIAPSDEVTREALSWLEQTQGPFFLVVLSIDPHAPYTPPRRFDPAKLRAGTRVNGLFPSLNREDLSELEQARIRELYQAEVAFNDDSFAALIDGLRARGALDDTIVVLTSDHGEEFWEYGTRGHGHTLSEPVLRIPLVIRHPASKQLLAGGRTARPIQLVDVVPTVLDLAGLPAAAELDGRSFFEVGDGPWNPILAGLSLDERRLLSARDERWKLVWDLEADTLALHDLMAPRPEASPLDPATDAAAAQAVARLRAALSQSVAASASRGGAPHSRAGELPREVEESLRALGYLD